MIKKNWKILAITSVVILLPILAGITLWEQLPEQIPIHWNAAGEVDGWSNRALVVFGMPVLMLALHWVTVLITSADPKRVNHSDKVMQLVFWLVPVLTVVVLTFSYSAAMGKAMPMEMLLPVLLGVPLIVIGNYLPKCRQNYTIGIKLPWTLDSEENWNRTHRLAGRIWVIGGIAMVAVGFLGLLFLVVPVMLILVLVPMVYSYILHRRGI